MKHQLTFLILIIFTVVVQVNSYALTVDSSRYEVLSGRKLKSEQKGVWDKKFSKKTYIFGKKPAVFLEENFSYIPAKSKVLDMGMGEGRNAVFLASKGYDVVGIDISSVAVKKATALAKEFGVKIKGIVASMTTYPITEGEFDSIICFYYVDRTLIKKMMKWLKPGGILIYEAHTLNQLDVKNSQYQNRDYLLKPGELLRLFPGLSILKYEEPLHLGEFTSSIILQKPKK